MIEFDADKKLFNISILVSDIKQVGRYHQSIVNLLERIEIDENTSSLMEDLDCVYELMSHLLPDQAFLDQHKDHFQGL
jgi:hypothetical protein